MKIIYSLFFLFLSVYAKADTITSWKVYYNSKLVKQFTFDSSSKEIHINVKDYKIGDYIAIKYGDDMPCYDCSYEFYVGTEGQEVFFTRVKNKYQLVSIDLKYIISEDGKDQLKRVFFDLIEIDRNGRRSDGVRLFDIIIN